MIETFPAIIMIFYVFVASHYTNELFSKQLREFLNDNRYAYHIIGLLLLLTIVIVVGKVSEPSTAIIYTIIGYFWFTLTTKLDIQWNIIIVVLLTLVFLYDYQFKNNYENKLKDKSLNEKDKEKLQERHKKKITYFTYGIMGITLFGTILYMGKQKVQHGGSFDLTKYLLD